MTLEEYFQALRLATVQVTTVSVATTLTEYAPYNPLRIVLSLPVTTAQPTRYFWRPDLLSGNGFPISSAGDGQFLTFALHGPLVFGPVWAIHVTSTADKERIEVILPADFRL